MANVPLYIIVLYNIVIIIIIMIIIIIIIIIIVYSPNKYPTTNTSDPELNT